MYVCKPITDRPVPPRLCTHRRRRYTLVDTCGFIPLSFALVRRGGANEFKLSGSFRTTSRDML